MVTFLGSDALTEAAIVLFSLFLFLLNLAVSKCLNHVFVLYCELSQVLFIVPCWLERGEGQGSKGISSKPRGLQKSIFFFRVVLLSPFSLSLTRVAMAEVVHRNLESMLPQLEELESSGIFTHDEIK